MLVVANVIFPAFYTPYVAQLFFPLAPLSAFIAEVMFYRWWSKEVTLTRLVAVALSANVISSVAGMLIAGPLPTGFAEQFAAARTGPAHGPDWNRFAILGWILAFVASVVIEVLVIASARRVARLQRPLLGVTFANAFSYTVLLAVFFLSVELSRL